MACDRMTVQTHLRQLSQLPYYATVTSETFSAWVTIMANGADDIPHVVRAVNALLQARALPTSPDDISDAVNATREHESPAAIYAGGCCGRMFPGWTYVGYDPRIEVDLDNPQDNDCAKVLIPSRCENGRVLRTVWREVKGLIQENGRPYLQPYDFSGKCKCQPGGTV